MLFERERERERKRVWCYSVYNDRFGKKVYIWVQEQNKSKNPCTQKLEQVIRMKGKIYFFLYYIICVFPSKLG